jgi:hypothetical protein
MKKAVRYAVIAVLIAWLITDPASATEAAHKLAHLLSQAAHGLSALASGL